MQNLKLITSILTLTSIGVLAGCSQQTAAPIVNAQAITPVQRPSVEALPGEKGYHATAAQPVHHHMTTSTYIVHPGDTLSGIALQFHMTYQQLAKLNQLDAPYTIYAGQKLIVPAVSQHIQTAETMASHSHTSRTNQTRTASGITWSWPLQGHILKSYQSSQHGLRHGIEIQSQPNQTVYAAAAGRVLYAGQIGSKEPGEMLIIQNGHGYLSVYSGYQHFQVTENQHIKRGQSIATVIKGNLTFEIRLNGRAVNPSHYLPG